MPNRFRRADGIRSSGREPRLYCHSIDRPRYPIFIAEIGSNHCGDLDRAIHMIEVAQECGAKAVKFQMFRWEDIVRRPADDDPRFELKPEWVPILQTHAHQREMAFLCTPFAPWAVPVLEPYVDGWKIGSFEALYTELVFALPADKKPLLLSLGMSWDRNIARMMGFIRSAGVILVHCVSKYPTPIEDAGLIRLKQYRNRGFRCGYSSHTAGWIDVVVASTYGISVVEKHFALDDQPISPDAGPWSLRPAEFTRMVKDTSDAIDARLSRFQRADCPPRRRIFGI